MMMRATGLLLLLAAGPAWAACSERPGTPTNVRLEPNGTNNSLNLIWRNTTRAGERIWFDIYFRDGTNASIGRDMTGELGGPSRPYGSGSAYVFGNLQPGKRYCASMRARTGQGTQGCISLVASNLACATVPLTATTVRPPAGGARPPAAIPPGLPASPVPPAPARQCDIVADIRITGCTNLDGTPSEYFTAGTASGCGTSEDEAVTAASLAYGASLGEDPGQCQYTKTVRRQSCACMLPAGATGARRAIRSRPIWSTFAVGDNGHWGQGVHRESFALAAQAALAACGDASCKVRSTTTDRCVAFAESRRDGFWWAAGSAPTQAQANANAIRYCQSGSAPPGSCGVAAASCRP